MDRQWVLEKLRAIVDMGMAVRPVLVNSGEWIGMQQPQLTAAIRALELIGKEQGMFIGRKEVHADPLESMDRTQLLQLRDLLTQRGARPNAAA